MRMSAAGLTGDQPLQPAGLQAAARIRQRPDRQRPRLPDQKLGAKPRYIRRGHLVQLHVAEERADVVPRDLPVFAKGRR